jgi:flavin-dependent dehydrogenase
MPSPEEMVTLMPDVPNTKDFFTFNSEFISQRTNRISFFSPEGKIIQTPFEGYTIHRGKWNASLVETGKKNQAEVWTTASAVDIKNGGVLVSVKNEKSIQIEPKILIGADGVNSRIAEWRGLLEKRGPEHFAIVKQHVMTGITSEKYDSMDIQMFFGEKYAPGAYAWIIPKNENTANVGVGVRGPMLKGRMTISKALMNLIETHPVASKILKGAQIQQTIGAIVPVGLPYRKTIDPKTKTILLGDAACQVVSSVGAGVPTSMVAGSIAAQTIMSYLDKKTSLEQYQIEWQNQMMGTFKRAYKLRHFFDKISTGKDSRIQWYMNRLRSSDVSKVVHCSVPWRLNLAEHFVPLLNKVIN